MPMPKRKNNGEKRIRERANIQHNGNLMSWLSVFAIQAENIILLPAFPECVFGVAGLHGLRHRENK